MIFARAKNRLIEANYLIGWRPAYEGGDVHFYRFSAVLVYIILFLCTIFQFFSSFGTFFPDCPKILTIEKGGTMAPPDQ